MTASRRFTFTNHPTTKETDGYLERQQRVRSAELREGECVRKENIKREFD